MPSVGDSAFDAPSRFLIYSEDMPCEPKPRAAHRIAHRVRLHRVRRPAAPEGVTPIPIVQPPAVQISALPEPVATPHHRHRPLAHRRPAVAALKGCVALRSERLNNIGLDFYRAPTSPLAIPAGLLSAGLLPDLDLIGDHPAEVSPGDLVFFSRPTKDETWETASGPTTATPEPQAWMLMILGVGLCGAALRRGRRAARFGA